MHLSWNEIRVRAARFADKWQDETREKGETQSFYNDFFEVFGVQRRNVARYEQHVAKKLDDSSGYIDLFWPGMLIVEQKSAGRDLKKAYEQAGSYFDALPERDRPRYILVSDFQTFELHDLNEREKVAFVLADLPDHVDKFGFILGRERRPFRDQDPANVEAAELVGRLHDDLAETGYGGHDLERFLVRTVFCLFADDTGIFEPRGQFLDFIENRTREDGTDLGPMLMQLHQVLNTPQARRPITLDEDLNQFPYVNGPLFEDQLPIPAFNSSMREKLLDACHFDWSNISPAIFGALFQSVMDPPDRRAQGAHYTTEKNILKVIEPLFMDNLRAEFGKLRARKNIKDRLEALRRFQQKLGGLRFFDPACGCGNFLIIAYRELRLLEIEVIREIRKATATTGQKLLDATWQSVVDVDQFYGIELGEFPVRIAETALWMMDHIMNNRLSLEFGKFFARIPLAKSPHILHDDALEVDWADLLPPSDCSFVLGNPPFVGAKFQTTKQRAQVRRIAALNGNGGTLDYVCAWFIKAGAYLKGSSGRIGFVSANSTTQGEQVAQLWPLLFGRCRLELAFAHRTFAWGSDARGQAHVHVVILGLDQVSEQRSERRLFSYPDIDGDPQESRHKVLSPYLFGSSNQRDAQLVVRKENQPINGLRCLKTGVQMIDNGLLTFDQDEYDSFLAKEPGAERFFRKYLGGDEYINGFHRWILYLANASPSDLRSLPGVRERIRQVQEYRASSCRKSTVAMAAYPTRVGVDERLSQPFLVLPNTSSERRDYIPIGWLLPDVIANQKLRILPNATLTDFALLTSAMHMAWMRTVTGRLESRYMYSVGVVYNTFPLPPNGARLSRLEPLAQAVLDARKAHPGSTLADLYDPGLMPPNLRRAHQALDRTVDRLYRRSGFASERQRVDHLFKLYEKMCVPLDTVVRQQQPKRPSRRRRKSGPA